ncbi:MAG: DUF177 domain-containing protein [Rikenellaceae bacterium]
MEITKASECSYSIDFKDLKEGEYRFEFPINGELFALYEGCEVLDGDCQATITMQRSESMLVLDVDIEGDIDVECDRCLDPCSVEVDFQEQLIVKFSDEEGLQGEGDGEVMWLPKASTSVDMTHYIYESIILSLPYQRVHAEGECNAEMIKKFKIVTGEEFDEIEAQAAESDNETMPAEELGKLAALKVMMEKESK